VNRLGLRRFPVVTLVVFAVSTAVALWQAADHRLLTALQRTPDGWHGEWWRTFTALFVQDGGLVGGISNLTFLLVIGAVAEQTASRGQWLVQYFGTGIVCEFIAYAWQPVGGGNSIAVCGITGVVLIALWRGDRPAGFASRVLLIWCVALAATQWPSVWLLSAAVIAALVGFRVLGDKVHRPVVAAVAVLGVVLAVLTNIHGAALLVGLTVAVLFAVLGRQYPSSSSALR
jgi:membrane associated rhomboid family serine protease